MLRRAALVLYVVASTLLVVTLRVGPDPGDPGGVVGHTRLFEKYQATEPFVAAYDPAIRPRRTAPDCARPSRAVTANSTYGRLNNALIALTHLLEFAATAPEPTVVVLPEHVKEWVPRTEFNYSGALGGWVCVADAPPAGLRVEEADLRDIYWWAAGPTTNFGRTGLPTSAELKGLILAQIVMRPQPGLRALVARVSPKGPYVAIHLRSLEGTCVARLRLEGVAVQRVTARDMGRDVTAEDLCSMSGAYVKAALRMDAVPRDWPILLVHDGQNTQKAGKLRKNWHAVETHATAYADLILAVRSAYFIGNPASSFSANVVMIRRALGASVTSSNLRVLDFPRPGSYK